jgi:hypothetical protein
LSKEYPRGPGGRGAGPWQDTKARTVARESSAGAFMIWLLMKGASDQAFTRIGMST